MKIMIKDPNSPYLYTLSQGKLLSNLTPYSSTYPNRPNVSVPPGFPLIYWLSITVSAFSGCSHEATELFNKFVEHCQQMEETKKLMMNAIRVFVFLVGKIVKDINRWVARGVLLTTTEAPPERVAFLRVQVYERVGRAVVTIERRSRYVTLPWSQNFWMKQTD